MPDNNRFTRTLVGFVLAAYTVFGNADAGAQSMPQFPPSSTVLQAVVNDLNHCIDGSIASAANSATTATTDAVMSKCAAPQAQLQQMLPPSEYDKGLATTRQRIDGVLADQKKAALANH